MFWSVCACAGPGQLKAAARAGVAGGRCSGSVSPSVLVPGVGPRKPAAVRLSAAHHAATAAVLPLLLLLSLNDGLVLNCPARCAEQTTAVTAPHHRSSVVVVVEPVVNSTDRYPAAGQHRYTVKDSGHSCVIVEGHIKNHPRSQISDI